MHIGVIPARAGSQRFPGKNRAKLNGQSLWQIQAEKSLELLDDTFINTDDKLIPEDSGIVKYGGQLRIYERPEHLRDGKSYRIDDVLIEMAHTLKWDDKDIIHLLQPTNPFVSRDTIEAGKLGMEEMPIDSVQSIWKVPNTLHAYSQRKLNGNFVEFAFPELRNKCYNSQRKPDFYAFAGYVACRVGSLLKYNNIWGERSVGIEVPFIESIDIDTAEDLEHAEKLAGTVL